MVSRHAKKRAEKRARNAGRDVEDRLEEPVDTSFEGIPSADLFFEDKAGAAASKKLKTSAQPDSAPPAGKQRKILKSAAILSAGRAASILTQPEKRKKKRALSDTPGNRAKALDSICTINGNVRSGDNSDEAQLDLWGEASAVFPVGPRRRMKAMVNKGPGPCAVEIDQPGCSYNPDAELHQDAVAAAVAVEVRKAIAQELMPKAPPRFSNEAVDHISELDMLQVDDDCNVCDDEAEGTADASAVVIDRRPPQQKTVTQRNREARRKLADKEMSKQRQRKALGKDILRAPDLVAEIEGETLSQQLLAKRRKADIAEKRAVEPPRLGKQVYEPAPVQVLLTEELHGSLRSLKSAPMLARDRYKSLQQRGIIEPRSRAQFKPGRKLVVQEQYSSR